MKLETSYSICITNTSLACVIGNDNSLYVDYYIVSLRDSRSGYRQRGAQRSYLHQDDQGRILISNTIRRQPNENGD